MNCDLYVKDKVTGKIHKVGTDIHDSLWVDSEGRVHYHNLQNGDGCCCNDDMAGYEFIQTECGMIFEYPSRCCGDCKHYAKANGYELCTKSAKYINIEDDIHDSLWVDSEGRVHYHNLQNGDGCCCNDDMAGYEFIQTECGMIFEYPSRCCGDCKHYAKANGYELCTKSARYVNTEDDIQIATVTEDSVGCPLYEDKEIELNTNDIYF